MHRIEVVWDLSPSKEEILPIRVLLEPSDVLLVKDMRCVAGHYAKGLGQGRGKVHHEGVPPRTIGATGTLKVVKVPPPGDQELLNVLRRKDITVIAEATASSQTNSSPRI